MGHKIAVPAVVLRDVANAALKSADEQERQGLTANARSLRRSAQKAFDASDGKSASLVSIDASSAAGLCAFGHDSSYHDSLRTMLEHQQYW